MEPTVSPDQPILAHRKPILILVARERNFLVMPVTTPTTASSPLFPLPTTTAAVRRIASIPACEFLHLAAAAARDRSSPSASPPCSRLDSILSYPILSPNGRSGRRERPAMSGVFGKVFGKSKAQSQATALASIDKLSEVSPTRFGFHPPRPSFDQILF